MPSTTSPAPAAPIAERDAGPRAMIGVLEFGESELRLWDLPFTIGRSSKNTLTIRDPHFSRTHCSIDATPRGYRVQSMSSRNPVRVNGRPIESFLLQDGDRIEISKHAFTFRVVDEDGNAVRPDLNDLPVARPVAVGEPSDVGAPEADAAPTPAAAAGLAGPAGPAPASTAPAAGMAVAPAPSARRPGLRHMAARAAQVGQAEVAGFAVGGMLVLVVLGIGAMLLVADTRAAREELEATESLARDFSRVRQATATAAIDQRDDARRERTQLDEQRRWLRARPVPGSLATGGLDDEPDAPPDRPTREPAIHQRVDDPPLAPAGSGRGDPAPVAPPAPPDPTPPAKPDVPPPLDPPSGPEPPPARVDPPVPVPAAKVPAMAGPAPRAGRPSLALLGLRIEGAKIAFVIDKSASQKLVLESVRAELTKAISALADAQAFTLVAFDGETRFFSRDLLPASARFKGLAQRFVEGLMPEGESRPDEALKAALALERLEALVVVTNGRLTTAATAMLRAAIERAASGGPRVYLVNGGALSRERSGAAGPSDPAHDELMMLAARQP